MGKFKENGQKANERLREAGKYNFIFSSKLEDWYHKPKRKSTPRLKKSLQDVRMGKGSRFAAMNDMMRYG